VRTAEAANAGRGRKGDSGPQNAAVRHGGTNKKHTIMDGGTASPDPEQPVGCKSPAKQTQSGFP
jgi:hypothetical protein